jgi:acid phosphatase family membrane protein YuiD
MGASVICSFCGSPSAHPATGCVYVTAWATARGLESRTIACYSCTVEFWRWVVRHTNNRKHLKAKGVDFYSAAGRWM